MPIKWQTSISHPIPIFGKHLKFSWGRYLSLPFKGTWICMKLITSLFQGRGHNEYNSYSSYPMKLFQIHAHLSGHILEVLGNKWPLLSWTWTRKLTAWGAVHNLNRRKDIAYPVCSNYPKEGKPGIRRSKWRLSEMKLFESQTNPCQDYS